MYILTLISALTIPLCNAKKGGVAGGVRCEDDVYKDCQRRVGAGACTGEAGTDDPHHEARLALAECRQSCQALINTKYSQSELPSIVQLYGGIQNFVTDAFGFKYHLCDPNGGFTSEGRKDVLFHIGSHVLSSQWVPNFTKTGFEKDVIPADLYGRILSEYKEVQQSMEEELCIPGVINCQTVGDDGEECFTANNRRTLMMQLSEATLEALRSGLQPLAEAWAGVRLEHTSTYGIRRYTEGSWLISHTDKFRTHVISAILNIGQAVRREWPLFILDNEGHGHQVILGPGEMVWYESARLLHGRPEVLEGDHYDNLFVHYRPTGLWYTAEPGFGQAPRDSKINIEDIKHQQNSQV